MPDEKALPGPIPHRLALRGIMAEGLSLHHRPDAAPST
jgi:hypothetical protein